MRKKSLLVAVLLLFCLPFSTQTQDYAVQVTLPIPVSFICFGLTVGALGGVIKGVAELLSKINDQNYGESGEKVWTTWSDAWLEQSKTPYNQVFWQTFAFRNEKAHSIQHTQEKIKPIVSCAWPSPAQEKLGQAIQDYQQKTKLRESKRAQLQFVAQKAALYSLVGTSSCWLCYLIATSTTLANFFNKQ